MASTDSMLALSAYSLLISSLGRLPDVEEMEALLENMGIYMPDGYIESFLYVWEPRDLAGLLCSAVLTAVVRGADAEDNMITQLIISDCNDETPSHLAFSDGDRALEDSDLADLLHQMEPEACVTPRPDEDEYEEKSNEVPPKFGRLAITWNGLA
jgi:hypothetical protein